MRTTEERALWAVVAILLFLVVVVLFVPTKAHADMQALVVGVVDGDTIKVSIDGGRAENIRLIGIDTPESKPNAKAFRDSRKSGQDVTTITKAGREAAIFTSSIVRAGEVVTIEQDVTKFDKYGRPLGYVYLPDGRMLNLEIVKAGFAQPMTYPPNVRHVEKFAAAYRTARERGAGLWRR